MSYNSLKNLFEKDSQKIIAQSSSLGSLGTKAESEGYLKAYKVYKERVTPQVAFSQPKNWVRYGSAEQYYVDAAANIYDSYPYDGSEKEKIQWHNSSSYFENYVFYLQRLKDLGEARENEDAYRQGLPRAPRT